MNYKIILILLIPFINSIAQEKLSLRNAIETALKNNFSINIAANQLEIADNNLTIGNAGFLPNLDADASYTQSITNSRQKFFDGRTVERDGAKSSNINAAIMLRWTIFDGLKMFASLDRLKELRKSGEDNFKLVIEKNINEISSTYFDVVRQERVLGVIRKNIQLSEERVDIAQSKLEVGSGSKFELLQAQVDLNEDKAALLREDLNLSDKKVKLNRLLGRDVNFEFEPVDSIIIADVLSFEDLKNQVYENNADIIIAGRNKNIAEIDLRNFYGDWLPRISVEVGYNFLRSTSEAGFIESNRNHGLNYGLRASFNLFNGLNTRRQIENAKINIEINKLYYEQTVRLVEEDLLNAYKKYENNLQRIKLEEENFKAAEENVDIAVERLKLGTITPLEFRETQRRLLDAQSRLVAAKFDAKSAEVELLMLSGNLLKNVRN